MAIVLHPLTWTPHLLDYRLSWSLYTLLSILGLFPNNRHSTTLIPLEYDLCLGYSNQLESAGLCEWAIYVLLNLTERHQVISREAAVALILDCHADELTTNPVKEAFLIHRLGVPKAVAKASYSHYTGDYHAEVSALISSFQWEHAHDLFLDTLVGNLFPGARLWESPGLPKPTFFPPFWTIPPPV
jgi:nuclear pore complex protein Nup98-Nup96